MAFTDLYLTASPAPYTPATLRGAWDDTASAVTKALTPNKLGSIDKITSVARAETNAAANYDVLLYRGVSGPLAAQTISGNIDVRLAVKESNSAADFAYHLHVYVTQGDSDTPRGTLLADYVETTGNEWSNASTGAGLALASAQALSSLAITSGDRIVVEVGYIALNASAASFTGTLWYGTLDQSGVPATDLAAGDTNVSNLAGRLIFSGSITENVVSERVTQLPVELLHAGTSGDVRVTQFPVEILHNGTAGDARVTQFVVEMLSSNGGTEKVAIHLSEVASVVISGAVAINVTDSVAVILSETATTAVVGGGTASVGVTQVAAEIEQAQNVVRASQVGAEAEQAQEVTRMSQVGAEVMFRNTSTKGSGCHAFGPLAWVIWRRQ